MINFFFFFAHSTDDGIFMTNQLHQIQQHTRIYKTTHLFRYTRNAHGTWHSSGQRHPIVYAYFCLSNQGPRVAICPLPVIYELPNHSGHIAKQVDTVYKQQWRIYSYKELGIITRHCIWFYFGVIYLNYLFILLLGRWTSFVLLPEVVISSLPSYQ